MQISLSVIRVSVGAVAVGLVLAACAKEPAPPDVPDHVWYETPAEARQAALDEGDHLLAEALEDGRLDRDEYELLFNRYLECSVDAGWIIPTGEPIWNPATHMDFHIPHLIPEHPLTPAQSREAQECDRQFDYAQTQIHNDNEPFMDPDLLEAVTTCVEEAGIETHADATWLGDMFVERPTHSIVQGCVDDAVADLYPGVFPHGLQLNY